MRIELRMKYLETIYLRYRKASKESKCKILDELCNVCKYNRKHAINIEIIEDTQPFLLTPYH